MKNKKPYKEWLLTNFKGGYCSQGTDARNLRRFHGLLVASKNLTRYNLLSHIEIIPQGVFQILETFPEVVYEIKGKSFTIEQRISFSPYKNAVSISFKLKTPKSLQILVRPFFQMRENHHLQKTPEFNFYKTGKFNVIEKKSLRCFFYPSCFFVVDRFIKEVEYCEDKIRDYEFKEKIFSPGFYRIDLKKGKNFSFYFCDEKIKKFFDFKKERLESRKNFFKNFRYREKFFEKLLCASLDFDAGDEIVAGYPWFGAWGRDTMISIPGLLLYPGRIKKTQKIFKKASMSIRKGLLPNIFSDEKNPHFYNSVDASLWFIWALSEYRRIVGFDDFLKSMKKTVAGIIKNYAKGTDFNIKMDVDGFIWAGKKGYALTWMDAVYKGKAFTPRMGKPVEIQGLWFNALKFARECGFYDTSEILEKIKNEFKKKFFIKERGYLVDYIDLKGRKNKLLRPNQIIALALMKELFTDEEIKNIIKVVRAKLFTPFGLRSLAPDERGYKKIYWGNLKKRDSAYHQGTVWSWLLMFYWQIEKPQKRKFLNTWERHLEEAGLGCFSEIFDAERPFYPRGCMHQAWTVAALLYISFLRRWITKR
ncbi:MAG: glycogen debranching enzyme N-terminal domain-containing protein [Elusimicrobia bacterium]|nr:glycogen debranching enzyme N-terminal domain-containing protein [Elusimicrobiota bacterium]